MIFQKTWVVSKYKMFWRIYTILTLLGKKLIRKCLINYIFTIFLMIGLIILIYSLIAFPYIEVIFLIFVVLSITLYIMK